MKKKYLDDIFRQVNFAFGLILVGLYFWPMLLAAGFILLVLSYRIGKMRKSAK